MGNLLCRELSKVVIDKRQELIGSILITFFDVGKNSRQVAHFGNTFPSRFVEKQSARSKQETASLYHKDPNCCQVGVTSVMPFLNRRKSK